MGVEGRERIFKRLFDQAEIASFTPQERREYEESVKDYRDYYSTVKTAHKKGRAEGRAEGLAEGEHKKAIEVARSLKKMELPIVDIANATGLSAEEIASL